MKISIIQQEIVWGDKEHNLSAFSQLVEPLYGKTDVVVLPEMWSTGFSVDKPYLAEDELGEAFHCVRRWAKDGDFAVAGSIMAKEGEHSVNRGFFCEPDGTLTTADKRHLFIGDEQRYFVPGNKHLDVTFRDVKFRVLICFDLRFPVWSRNVGGNSYDVLIYTANWPKDRIEAWDTLTKARAMENQSYVCAVNAVGVDSYHVYHCGHSVLLDPRGNVLVDFEENAIGCKTGEIDLEKLNKVRNRLPFWKCADTFTIQR
ncbi:MAG: nitrilase-related carbon-nitrogen hydrolase [Bacteroidales bacterium]|nr:nitrilase-related carbon-nitrogen hydrolase [Bacteroidales bacterium]